MNLVWGAWLHVSYIVKVRYFFYNPFFIICNKEQASCVYYHHLMSRHGSTKIILWPLGHGSCSSVWPHWPCIDNLLFLEKSFFFPLCSKLKSGPNCIYSHDEQALLYFTRIDWQGYLSQDMVHVTSELSFLTYMYWTSGDQIKCSIHPKFNTTGIKSKHWEFNRPQQAIILYMWVQYK